jgi:hypothetical protein
LKKQESLLQKQQEKLQRKLENKKLAEEESNQLKTSNKKVENFNIISFFFYLLKITK